MRQRRRTIVFAGSLALLQCAGMSYASRTEKKRRSLSLADFGGVPGANARAIAAAFGAAFEELKEEGGGKLVIPEGVYDLGSLSNGVAIEVAQLRNVLIAGHGAQLTMETAAEGAGNNFTPAFFRFVNPERVTVAGLAFKGYGSNLAFRKSGGRQGAVCIDVFASRPCEGFKTVDCVADDVVTFLRSDNRSNPYQMSGFDIHATVRNSYYGIQMLRNGRYSRCRLTTLNVRRAFISHATRDWDIGVAARRTQGPGSNAHVVLDTFPDGPVLDCTISVSASGDLDGYDCLGSICHQGPDGSYSFARNVRFTIAIENSSSAPRSGFIAFTAEPESGIPPGIRSTTAGAWENISIKGTVPSSYKGRVVANPSVSSARTNSIYIAANLSRFLDADSLPPYFRVMK
ncbi:hypothetical protein [Noviherbaspirillum sp. ST9]|uniref:hypothetical protein n=1 Tax=Noviherbaspirillum sp. ST9 TaxID=3401606 RepID=UPI003B58934B